MAESYSPQVGQIGSQLDTTFFLFDNCIRNMDTVPLPEYERMLETDETVATGMHFLILAILMKLGEYTNENAKMRDFVRDNFEGMKDNLYTACEEILSGLWAGYSGSEIIWRPDGSRIALDKIVTYHPKTLLIQVDRQTGEYMGLKQWRWFAGSPVDIDAKKAILYTFNRRFGNHYGCSIFKPIRKNWLIKDPILKMWGRALDRFGTPVVATFTPDDEIEDPDNPGQTINQLAYAARILERLQNGTGLALRAGNKEDGTESRVEVLSNGSSGVGEAFNHATLYLNKMLMRGLLIPTLMADDGNGAGSYALGQAHFEIFNMNMSSIFRGLKEVLLEQLVRPMLEYNFGPQKNFGDFTEIKLAQETRDLLSTCFMQLTNSGWITPQNQEDMDAVRDAMNLPKREVEPPETAAATKAVQEYNRYPVQEGEANGDPLGNKPAEETE